MEDNPRRISALLAKFLHGSLLASCVSFIVGVAASIAAAVVFLFYLQDKLTTITIPVLIQGQDIQGSQFALGVTRAEELATRYGMDQLGPRRIRPIFLSESNTENEEALTRLLNDIRSYKPPLVIGPLQSSHALRVVPRLVADGTPAILGIPTSPAITEQFNGKEVAVWRLSPTDRLQSVTVAKAMQALLVDGEESLLLYDGDDNPSYSDFLRQEIARAVDISKSPRPRTIELKRSESSKVEEELKLRRPRIIIYAGMPPQAIELLKTAERIDLQANWIFTDGCMLDRDLVSIATRLRQHNKNNRFFITFQAPPPAASKGLRQYLWYTQSIGGIVRGADLDGANCSPETAATSYEVFGFDSYMLALGLLRRASSATQSVSQRDVSLVMKTTRLMNDPFLLMGAYNFGDNGDNSKLQFHVYEIENGCVSHVEKVLNAKGREVVICVHDDA